MTSSDVQVQGSNDWSIASKLSTVTAGYYVDPYINHFVQKPVKRSALIHRGYYVRSKAMEFVFTKFLSTYSKSQIISLGAGFDSSYFVLRHRGHSECVYIEIDFPDVVRRKQQLIKCQPSLSELAADENYHIIEADLRDLTSLSKLLLDSKLLDMTVPTLMISECAITYMDEPSSSKLIEWCAKTFENAVFSVYEQIRPTDGFGRVMQRHFNQLGIPLLSLPVYPDQESQRQRYLRLGWAQCQVYDIGEFVSQLISADELERVRQIEPFDEYEGFHEKCSHYIILTAVKGCCSPPLPPKRPRENPTFHSLKSWQTESSTVQRYGHASCTDSNGNLWISGGFGVRPQGHGRLDDLTSIEMSSTEPEMKTRDKKLARMHHSMHQISLGGEDYLLIYGGRTHPGMAFTDVGIVKIRDDVSARWIDPPDSAEWPEPRWRHSSIILDPSTLFIAGGRNKKQIHSDAWVLDLSQLESNTSSKWRRFVGLPSGRHSATASFWNETVFLFGGIDESETLCSKTLIYTKLEQPEWKFPSWNGPEPKSRYSHQALVTSDGRLVITGGVADSFSPAVCIVNILDWSFVEYCLPVQDMDRPVLLASHSFAMEEGNELTIKCWGGGGLCFSFGTHLNSVMITMKI